MDETLPSQPELLDDELANIEQKPKLETPLDEAQPQLTTSLEIVESENALETVPVLPVNPISLQPSIPDEKQHAPDIDLLESSLSIERITEEQVRPFDETLQESSQPDDIDQYTDASVTHQDVAVTPESINISTEKIEPVDHVTTEKTEPHSEQVNTVNSDQSQVPSSISTLPSEIKTEDLDDQVNPIRTEQLKQTQTTDELTRSEETIDNASAMTSEQCVSVENVHTENEVDTQSAVPHSEPDDDKAIATSSLEVTLATGSEDVILTESVGSESPISDISLILQPITGNKEAPAKDIQPTIITEQQYPTAKEAASNIKPTPSDTTVPSIVEAELIKDEVTTSQVPAAVQSAPESGPSQIVGIVDEIDGQKSHIVSEEVPLEQAFTGFSNSTAQPTDIETELNAALSTDGQNPSSADLVDVDVPSVVAKNEKTTQKVTFEDLTYTPEDVDKYQTIEEEHVNPTPISSEKLSNIERQAETLVRETLASAMAELTENLLKQDGLEIQPTLVSFQLPDDAEHVEKIFTASETEIVTDDEIITISANTMQEIPAQHTTSGDETRPSLEIIELPDQAEEVQSGSSESFEIVEVPSQAEQFEIVDAPSPDMNTYDMVEEGISEYSSEVPDFLTLPLYIPNLLSNSQTILLLCYPMVHVSELSLLSLLLLLYH